jgi:fatty acid desaturase
MAQGPAHCQQHPCRAGYHRARRWRRSASLRSEFVRPWPGTPSFPRIWLRHFLAVGLLFWLIGTHGSLHPAAYFLAAYFGMGLLMVRSFIEHQAVEKANQRSVIIETRGPLSLLFLNNNFHSVHHAYPSLAWYRIPSLLSREPVEVSAHERWLPLRKLLGSLPALRLSGPRSRWPIRWSPRKRRDDGA